MDSQEEKIQKIQKLVAGAFMVSQDDNRQIMRGVDADFPSVQSGRKVSFFGEGGVQNRCGFPESTVRGGFCEVVHK